MILQIEILDIFELDEKIGVIVVVSGLAAAFLLKKVLLDCDKIMLTGVTSLCLK